MGPCNEVLLFSVADAKQEDFLAPACDTKNFIKLQAKYCEHTKLPAFPADSVCGEPIGLSEGALAPRGPKTGMNNMLTFMYLTCRHLQILAYSYHTHAHSLNNVGPCNEVLLFLAADAKQEDFLAPACDTKNFIKLQAKYCEHTKLPAFPADSVCGEPIGLSEGALAPRGPKTGMNNMLTFMYLTCRHLQILAYSYHTHAHSLNNVGPCNEVLLFLAADAKQEDFLAPACDTKNFIKLQAKYCEHTKLPVFPADSVCGEPIGLSEGALAPRGPKTGMNNMLTFMYLTCRHLQILAYSYHTHAHSLNNVGPCNEVLLFSAADAKQEDFLAPACDTKNFIKLQAKYCEHTKLPVFPADSVCGEPIGLSEGALAPRGPKTGMNNMLTFMYLTCRHLQILAYSYHTHAHTLNNVGPCNEVLLFLAAVAKQEDFLAPACDTKNFIKLQAKYCEHTKLPAFPADSVCGEPIGLSEGALAPRGPKTGMNNMLTFMYLTCRHLQILAYSYHTHAHTLNNVGPCNEVLLFSAVVAKQEDFLAPACDTIKKLY